MSHVEFEAGELETTVADAANRFLNAAGVVNEILTLSGMDPFEAVRVVNKLLEVGIVEVSP